MPRLSRRTLLTGAGSAVVAAGAAGTGVQQGWLPGRPWVQAHLGLNGEPGTVPDVEPGPVFQDRFVSTYRSGAEVRWAEIRPPGHTGALRTVVALPGLGQDLDTMLGSELGLDRFLAAHVAAGGFPFGIVTCDVGTGYYHPRPDGDDGAVVLREVLPRAVDHDSFLFPTFIGFLGWSMGGYGALRLAAQLGAGGASAVVASSPALWTDAEDASSSGFADAAEYDEFSVMGRQRDLDGIAVRVDCGTGDPFYRAVEDYVDGFPDDAHVTSSFQPGAHDPAYWRRMLPAQLDFLGRRLAG